MMSLRILLLACTALSLIAPAQAQEQKPAPAQAADAQTSSSALEISADKALEWDRVNKKYFARGNAIAKQNDFQVNADTLVADYRDSAKGQSEIYRLTATGNVILTSGANKAYGEKAVYEVDAAKAVMTGGDLRVEGDQMNLKARERFEYYSNEGKMVAVGSPVITNKDSTLTADSITAWTADKSAPAATETKADAPAATAGLRNLKRAEAVGNVVITTPREKATADKGIYTGDNDTVELLGNVKLNQGQNVLEGTRAEMNMTTNVSKLFAAPEKGGRVKGVFFPSSQKSTKKK